MDNENKNINPFLEAIPDQDIKPEEENQVDSNTGANEDSDTETKEDIISKSDDAKTSVSEGEESVTVEPVTEGPKMEEPKMEEPATDEAVVSEPTTEVPGKTSVVDNYSYNIGTKTTGYQSDYRKEVVESEMSLGDWVLTILAMFLPCCVGIVIYFVWAFGERVNPNRKNFCRAWLIIHGVLFVLGVLIWLVFFLLLSTSI